MDAILVELLSSSQILTAYIAGVNGSCAFLWLAKRTVTIYIMDAELIEPLTSFQKVVLK